MLTDEAFLGVVASERRQSIGFEQDQVLVAEREEALNYFKGFMPDVPSLPNRSKAVSRDVADAVETLMPDLMEIFTGGDDVATFKPRTQADEVQARQETDYVNQAVFGDNDGFMALYSLFKDALLMKVGVVKFDWEPSDIAPERFEGSPMLGVALAQQVGEVNDLVENGEGPDGAPLFDFTLSREQRSGQVRIRSVPPEDFTVAKDTVKLNETTYCAWRTRPRAQELIARGLPRDLIDELPQYGTLTDETLILARDQAGENLEQQAIQGPFELRTVEVVEHYVRIDARGNGAGAPQLWRVLTGGTDSVLLEKEEVDRLPFAALTPYIVTHRFYGESVADKLVEIQRIKTALTRMMLDSGYFALNQRSEVAMERANDFTLSDLLRNEPGLPVRSKSGDAVRPIGAGQLSFPVMEALEYVSVMAESRTGIVRNAQGLNPDTLHDTATGAQALMSAAAKRVRMIARIFAETGLKDLFLGVHALLRKHQVDPVWAQLNSQWVQLNPSAWAEREAMTIELGLGSSGRAQDLALSQLLLGLQKEIIQLQQGVGGPFVTAQNLSNALTMAVRKAGFRAPELYFSNPAQAPPQPPKPAPPGDPAKMAEVQARAQADQSRLQLDTHRQRSADVADALRLRAEAEDRAFVRQAHDDKMRLEHRRLDLEASKLALKTDTERHGQGAKAATAVTTRAMQDHAVVAKAHLGAAADLAVQAARSQDARLLAEHERALDAARDARAPSAGGEGEAP